MATEARAPILTDRWHELVYHPTQNALWRSPERFVVCPAGRRSGKTEYAKRKGVKAAIELCRPGGLIPFCAPTRDQAKRIYWEDLKALVPSRIIDGRPRESTLEIRLVTGVTIAVVGMDRPERIEGVAVDGAVVDEYADMKPDAWTKHLRPALSTKGREGWAWLIGVPNGRNHYYDLAMRAQNPAEEEWGYYHWLSREIIDPAEVEQAKRDLDPLTFRQEYEGSFEVFEGSAYYSWLPGVHNGELLQYDKGLPLIVGFDFNRAPGVAAYLQESYYKGDHPKVEKLKPITKVIGQVYIPQGSTTPAICRKILADWEGRHEGDVYVYGDATGGALGSAKLHSDWEYVEHYLRRGDGKHKGFGGRVHMRVKSSNPPERSRVIAVNSRLQSADETIRLLVDPDKAPEVVKDFEGVTILEGSAGEIDKRRDPKLTHLTDAIGYYIEAQFPVRERKVEMMRI